MQPVSRLLQLGQQNSGQIRHQWKRLNRFKQILALGALFALAGCSSFQNNAQNKAAVTSPGRPLLSNTWSLDSKIGIRTPKENGTAQLNWQQMGNEYVINITGPLGKHIGTLERRGETVSMTSSDGQTQTAESEDQLILNAIGEPLPVEQLQFWIKGLKAPFYPIVPVEADASSVIFIQKNWRVKMAQFENIDGYKLPQRLEFKYPADSAEENQLTLRVLVKQWTLPQESALNQ